MNRAAILFPILARDVFARLALFGYPLGGTEIPPSDLLQAVIHRVYYEQRCAAVGLRAEPETPQMRGRYERVM